MTKSTRKKPAGARTPAPARSTSGAPAGAGGDWVAVARAMLADPHAQALQAGDAANIARLLSDHGAAAGTVSAAAKAGTKAAGRLRGATFSPEQIVSMARQHYQSRATTVSAEHTRREIERFLSERGMA